MAWMKKMKCYGATEGKITEFCCVSCCLKLQTLSESVGCMLTFERMQSLRSAYAQKRNYVCIWCFLLFSECFHVCIGWKSMSVFALGQAFVIPV